MPAQQESFIIQSPGTGAEIPTDLSDVVTILEHNVYLQMTLRTMSHISQLGGFIAAESSGGADEARIRDYYGERTDFIAQNVVPKRQQLASQAKVYFAKAWGLNVIRNGFGVPDPEARASIKEDYAELGRRYAGAANSKARHDALVDLTKAEVIMRRPAEPTSPQSRPRYSPQLSSRDKLLVLQDDPLAGFLPSSNYEKNMAITFLDYLRDVETYPLGAVHQLDEVFIRRARGYSREDLKNEKVGPDGQVIRRMDASFGTEEAIQAVHSITHAMGDFLTSSLEQIVALRDLKSLLEGINPRIHVGEEIDLSHPGLASIVRYLDQAYYREKGVNPPGVTMSVFRSRAERLDARTREDKGKIVRDPYTDPNPTKVAAKRLAHVKADLTVGMTLVIIDDVIKDCLKRAGFWDARLHETAKRRFAWEAGERILELAAS